MRRGSESVSGPSRMRDKPATPLWKPTDRRKPNLPDPLPPAEGAYRKRDFSECDLFHLLYPLGMREEELRRYFMGEVSVSQLAKDISGSVVKVDDVRSEIRIADMQGSFSLQRDHVIRLCEAFLERALTPEALTTVAFALQASDAFEWEDEVISEVLSDWSAPEVNFELNAETLNMHRDWLLGFGEPPVRNSIDPSTEFKVVSVRTKTTY
jgi:hypothetical protein